jgi:hypothetical protein
MKRSNTSNINQKGVETFLAGGRFGASGVEGLSERDKTTAIDQIVEATLTGLQDHGDLADEVVQDARIVTDELGSILSQIRAAKKPMKEKQ